MRWNNLRSKGAEEAALFGTDVVARTFDTPEFAGTEFYEVQARSIINKVPGASAVPFRWTINPYRGCTHACRYCLAGDTPILMRDGRTKPLEELRVGDQIYGTRRDSNYRRYVPTTVLSHWSTYKPAYRIVLEDGTVLTASGDHRFLTGRGWKYVTGSQQGASRRPHLTIGTELMGTGQFAGHPAETGDYRRGYLCGMLRGDAHLAEYRYERPGRSSNALYRFRLASADVEAIDRTQAYLAACGVQTDRFSYTRETSQCRAMTAIRTSRPTAFNRITELMAWPAVASDDWHKGFLAGVFDAEGSCSRGIWRISNTDPEMIEAIGLALKRFGFRYVIEDPNRGNGMRVVRLLGGLAERLRFFHTVDPGIIRKRLIDDVAIKTAIGLRVASIEPTGLELPLYDITTGTGDFIANGVVSHNCFARNTHTYLDLDAGHDFDTRVVVKVNAAELLRRELAKPTWGGEHIAMGTNTDPYQRAEGRYRLMPGIIAALCDARNPFSILTKGTLILRDLELLREAARVIDVGASVSVGSVDSALWRQVEPGTPNPRARLDACRQLHEAGIGCGVLMAPILPYLTDAPEQLDETVRAIAAAGAASVTPIVLHLRPGAREWYFSWLARDYPELVPAYEQLYHRGAYAPRSYQREIADQVKELAARYGVGASESAEGMRLRPGKDDDGDGDGRDEHAGERERSDGAEQLTLM